MRVLLRIRGDVEAFSGGDWVQLKSTKAELEKLGVTCFVAPGVEPFEEPVDIVHLFNTTRIHETYLQYQQAKEKNLPVVLSPIWHSAQEMKKFYGWRLRVPNFPIWPYLAIKEAYYAGRSKISLYPPAVMNFKELIREVVSGCDAVLPNSEPEQEILQRELGVKPKRIDIVPLGCDPMTCGVTGQRKNVVCLGRVEPRKNQLGIARAFKQIPQTDDKLLFYGNWNAGHFRYRKKVERELEKGRVEYGGMVENVGEIYSNAKVVVLASFFETCGLVILEGLQCGAQACVSRTRYTEWFYGDAVEYCDPYSEESIARGIQAALCRTETEDRDFLQTFTWQNAARETLRIYEEILNKS